MNVNEEGELSGGFDRVLEIPVTVHVELGRRQMCIQELLSMEPGGLIELSVAAGEPLSIYANRTLVARGEAVIVGERYGVRITEIVATHDGVRRLSHSRGT